VTHGLGAIGAEIDDGEPAMAEADIAVHMDAGPIRTTMGDQIGQCPNLFFTNRPGLANNGENSAQAEFAFPPSAIRLALVI
jgi:hypothetical protein